MNPSRWARQKPPRRLVSYWPVGVPGFEVIAFQKWGFPKPWGILSPLDESMVYCQDVGKLHIYIYNYIYIYTYNSTGFLHTGIEHISSFFVGDHASDTYRLSGVAVLAWCAWWSDAKLSAWSWWFVYLVGGFKHFLFSISYMGCHPSHWLSYFS